MVEESCADVCCQNIDLNMQGFRKVDPNRWEFANEGFLRGQKHLLKGIQRRKSVPIAQQQVVLSAGGPCLEVGKFGGLQGEIDGLRRDKNLLMSEVIRLHQEQQATQQEILTLSQRLHDTEQKQQQMMIFLAKAMQNPSFVAHLAQKTDQTKQLESITRKRRLTGAGSSNAQGTVPFSSEVQEDGAGPDVNEELQALLYEMAQEQYSGDGAPHVSLGLEDGQEQSLSDSSRPETVKRNRDSQNVVKLEVREAIQDSSSGSFQHNDCDAFWKQLIEVQRGLVTANMANGTFGEQTASISSSSKTTLPFSTPVLESSDCCEPSKSDVDDITKQLVHLGSSPSNRCMH
ncbi:hypothetical protein L7F22_064421 [Adiantum nelumboides]|nr:hypothetical protein [Adiantum nelumboides]